MRIPQPKLLAASSIALCIALLNSGSEQRVYPEVKARQDLRARQLVAVERPSVVSNKTETEIKNAPRRLDLLAGASGQPLNKTSIVMLSSKIGDGFLRLVPDDSGHLLDVKEPGGRWHRLPNVHFQRELVFMRDGFSCVRLEDPLEPTANYYGLCLTPGGISIQAVGEVESFS